MAMKALRDSASGGLGKFILFGILCLAAGGLMFTDVGGFFRGGVGSSDVAKVGNEKISIVSFDRTVRQTLGRLGMSPQEAHRLGYINQLLGGEIRGRLLNQASDDTGIRIPKSHIAEHVQQIVAPFVSQGQDPKDVLNQILLSQGMSEQGFVASISRDMSNSLLSDALKNGAGNIGEDIAADLYRHQKETRDVSYIAFPNDAQKDLPEPTDEQLQSLYQGTKENFAEAETRRLKLVTIKMDALKETLEIDEEEIRATYDDNIDYYTVNESRTLDQAIINTEEDAKAVIAAVNDGKSLEKAVESVVSNTAGYMGEKDFQEDQLLEEIKDDVLAAKKNGAIVGPINSALGWYVIVVKKINPEKVKSYKEAKSEIKDELMENALIDQQYELANAVDDMLAGGATLEEVADEIDLNIQTLPVVNRYGQGEDGKDALGAYKENRNVILESGFELEEGETSPVFESQGGKFMAVHLHNLKLKSYKSFDEVKDRLKTQWMNDQKRVSNRLRIANFLKSGQSLQDIAKAEGTSVNSKKKIKRNQDPDGILNVRSVMNLFEAPVGELVMVDIDGGVALATVTGYHWPSKVEGEEFDKFKARLSSNAENEALGLYLQGKQAQYGVKFNQPLLNRAYGPESQSY